MNKNINLCEILKGHEGETFYSPLLGNITYKSDEDGLLNFTYGSSCFSLTYDGTDDDDLLAVFPSKDQRDWNKWLEEQKPKVPKTWSELVAQDKETICLVEIDEMAVTTAKTPIEKSALALLKIHQLIEVGYGGNITKEEWETGQTVWYVFYGAGDMFYTDMIAGRANKCLIAFHTKKQAEEFLSKPENVELLKDYFMIP